MPNNEIKSMKNEKEQQYEHSCNGIQPSTSMVTLVIEVNAKFRYLFVVEAKNSKFRFYSNWEKENCANKTSPHGQMC